MQKQVFTGIIYHEFYTRCQNFRLLVSSWEVGITPCESKWVNKSINHAEKLGTQTVFTH